MLLHVHEALLYELQAQLHNLSATVRGMSRMNTGCTIKVIRTTPLLNMRDTLPPGTHTTDTVVSCKLQDIHATFTEHFNTIYPAAVCPAAHMTVVAVHCLEIGNYVTLPAPVLAQHCSLKKSIS